MVTLKEYKAYLKVKRFIDGHDESEIISRLMGDNKYIPLIIETDGTFLGRNRLKPLKIGMIGLNRKMLTPDISMKSLASPYDSNKLLLTSGPLRFEWQ